MIDNFPKVWLKTRLILSNYQNIKFNSKLYFELIKSGIDKSSLDKFILSGRKRKSLTAKPANQHTTNKQIDKLLVMGGSIAGGATLNSWLFMESNGDYDIFFPNLLTFVKAHLAVYDNSSIDVCLYDLNPCEGFDLGISRCSYSSGGFKVEPECERALKTGVSSIILPNLINCTATLRRVAKYGHRYGIKFKQSEILFAAALGSVDNDVIKEALKHCSK